MKQAIVQVVQKLAPPGGLEVMVLELRRLLEATFDVHVVSLEGTAKHLRASWPKVAPLGDRLYGLDKPPPVNLATVLRLTRLFRELSPIAVHTHHIGPLLYGGLAARLAGVPRLIHTEHDAWHLDLPRQRLLQRLALSFLRPRLVADAQIVADALARAIPGSRPLVIPNGVDTARFSPGDRAAARRRLGLPSDVRLIGTAGRLEEVKGQDILIEALAHLPSGVAVAIAGDGSRRQELEAQAARLGVGRRTYFLGHIDDIAMFYRALELFCLPSRAEGLPLSLVEAQACGIPAVASDVGAVREVLAPSISRAVPAGDSRRLARAIEEMLARHQRADPRPFVVERYNLPRMADAYKALLAT
jgi:glycosyltransferase involved in cell wall biosynthesis